MLSGMRDHTFALDSGLFNQEMRKNQELEENDPFDYLLKSLFKSPIESERHGLLLKV